MTGSIWDQVLSRIETKVNRHIYYTWFQPTSFIADQGSILQIRVPNAMFRDWLTKHYAAVLDEALAEIDRQGTAISFISESAEAREPVVVAPPAPVPAPESSSRPMPLTTLRPGVLPLAIRSIPSSSDRRINSRTRPAGPLPRRRRVRITRCSSTAAWDLERRI